MSDSFIQLPTDGSGKQVDSELLTGGTYRQRMQIGGALLAAVAAVANSAPAGTEYGLIVRPIAPALTTTKEIRSSTGGTPIAVTLSTSSQPLFATNANRLGATIFNDGAANLYIGLGVTPTTTSYAVKITPYGYYEIPYGFTGAVNGIADTATGTARGQELT